MIDYNMLAFTLAVLVAGVIYACLCSNVGGTEDDGDATQSAEGTLPVTGGDRRTRPRGRVIAFRGRRAGTSRGRGGCDQVP